MNKRPFRGLDVCVNIIRLMIAFKHNPESINEQKISSFSIINTVVLWMWQKIH